MTSADNLPLDAAAADALLSEFEAGTISLDRFHHRQHLAVAAWLLLRDSHDSALDRMRAGLRNLLKVNGKAEGYDDQLTVRWMRTLAESSRGLRAGPAARDAAERRSRMGAGE